MNTFRPTWMVETRTVSEEGASSGSNRVNRGGNYGNDSSNCRSGYRNWNSPGNANWNIGFRAALALAPASLESYLRLTETILMTGTSGHRTCATRQKANFPNAAALVGLGLTCGDSLFGM